jgi:hypothetical protein
MKPEFLVNSYVSTKLDLILNFITSEDITEYTYYVVRLYWIRYKNFFFHFSKCDITANYEYTYVKVSYKHPNYYMYRARFHFKTTLNVFFF